MNQIEQLEYIRDEIDKIPNDMFCHDLGWADKDKVNSAFDYEPVCIGCHLAIILSSDDTDLVTHTLGGVARYDYYLGVKKLAEIMGISYEDLKFRVCNNGAYVLEPFETYGWSEGYKEVMVKVINKRIEELQDD